MSKQIETRLPEFFSFDGISHFSFEIFPDNILLIFLCSIFFIIRLNLYESTKIWGDQMYQENVISNSLYLSKVATPTRYYPVYIFLKDILKKDITLNNGKFSLPLKATYVQNFGRVL